MQQVCHRSKEHPAPFCFRCHPPRWPYGFEGTSDTLAKIVGMSTVAGTGAIQFNHPWMCTLKTSLAKEFLPNVREFLFKGRCIIIDPNMHKKEIKDHWFSTCIQHKSFKRALEPISIVKSIVWGKRLVSAWFRADKHHVHVGKHHSEEWYVTHSAPTRNVSAPDTCDGVF